MKRFLFVICILFSLSSNAQSTEGTELGLEGTFHVSNLGGSFGVGVKYGWKFGEYFIAGPSARYQRSWFQVGTNTNSPTTTGFNVFGGGGFIHARFFNALFAGAEAELLHSPLAGNFVVTGSSNWAPSLLLGGGFSMEFNEKWRLNLGIFYDAIDHPNSPLRTQYFMRNSLGALLPVIYRINFFFPIGE
ncbi:MAG: hypothetical protein NXI10_11310 [bacterium]|nr:hypothetical protein [bacterium]